MKKIFSNFLVISSLLLFAGCGGGGSDSKTTLTPSGQQSPKQNEKPDYGVNKAPIATFSSFSVSKNVRYDGQLKATDPDGDELKYVIVSQPQHGTVVLHDNGCFTYTPDSGYVGKDTFSYKASDDISSCAVKTVTIDVNAPTIQKPTAPSNLTVTALSSTTLKLTWNDNSDNEDGFVIYKDGKPVCTTKANQTSFTLKCGLEAGESYSFEVKAQNEAGTSDAASATGTTKDVTTPPNAPTELNATAVEKTSVRLTWRDNSDNESGFEIYQDGVKVKTISAGCTCTVIDGLKECGSYEFVVKAVNKIGSASSSTITVDTACDIVKPTPDTTKPIITLKGASSITLTVGDSYIDEGASANDNIDGDITANIVKTGNIDTTKVGTYTIKYNVTDKAGNRADEVTRTVIVQEKSNTTPTATPQSVTMDEDTNKTITLNGSDADGDALTYTVVTQPTHGTYANGIYIPVANYNGVDSFTFKANDGKVDSAPATVSITINDINDAPTVDAGADANITEGIAYSPSPTANDIDGTITSTIWKEGNTILTFPKSDFSVGEHNLTMTVTDNDGATASDTLTLTVNAAPVVNDCPLKVKTGQINSYANFDDGDLQRGVERSYTRDDTKEVVTDNATHLMWQDDSQAQTVKKTWQEAIDYCEALTLGDYSDWRLPKIEELMSITDKGRVNPAIDPTFQNVVSNGYWSSTADASFTSGAWHVGFYLGSDYWYLKSGDYYVRCVRSTDN